MRPAFSSPQHAAAFAVLLLLVLLAPVLAGKTFLPPREQAYATQGWGNGPFPWIRHEIFEETNDIDIAFMGSSHILHAVDTPYVQAKLSEKLGRPAVLRTIAWGGAGYDALFFIAQDLLAHRKVKLLVFYDEVNAPGARNSAAATWFRWGENAPALKGLPFRDQSLYYLSALMGLPRNVLALVRPNLPAPLVTHPPNYWEQHYRSASIVQLLGATRSELGFNYDPLSDNFTPFTPFTPHTKAKPAYAEIYSPVSRNDFVFEQAPLPRWQLHFARQLSELAWRRHCQLAMLSLPVLADATIPVLQERAYWPDIFGGGFSLVGIPPATLFSGLNDQQLHWLFSSSACFNKNGMAYFTPLITPALLQILATAGKT